MALKDIIDKIKELFSSFFSKTEEQDEDEIDKIITGKVLKGEFDLPNFGEAPNEPEPEAITPDETPVGFEHGFRLKLILAIVLVCFGAGLIFVILSKLYSKTYPVAISSSISSIIVNQTGAYAFITVTLSKNASFNSNVKFDSVYIINGSNCTIESSNLYNNLAILNIVCVFKNESDLENLHEIDLQSQITTRIFLFSVKRLVNSSFIFEGSDVLPSTKVLRYNNISSPNQTNNYRTYDLLLYINPMNITYNYSLELPLFSGCNSSLAKAILNQSYINISNQNTQEYLKLNISINKTNTNTSISCVVYTIFLGRNITLYTAIFNLTKYSKTEKIKIVPMLNYYLSTISKEGYVGLNLSIESPEPMTIQSLQLILEPFNIVIGSWSELNPFKELNKSLLFSLNKTIVSMILGNISSEVIWLKGVMTYKVNNITDTYTFSKPLSYFEYYTNMNYNITPNSTTINLYMATICSKNINVSIKVLNISYNISEIKFIENFTNQTEINCNQNKIIGIVKLNETLSKKLFEYLEEHHTVVSYETIYLKIKENNKEIIKKYTVMLPMIYVPSNTTNTTTNQTNISLTKS